MNSSRDSITVVGSFLEAGLPSELSKFFPKGILIDRRNGTPMEMDGYSLYLGLRAMERRHGVDFSAQRKAIVDALLMRMKSCNGFWTHGPWTDSDCEIHMRFTAAAIRLLSEALLDGLLAEPAVVVDALRKHLSYREEIKFGTWFLHDSLEVPGVWPRHPNGIVFNGVWNSTENNCLVLNTHVDTLATAIYVLRHVDMSDADRQEFTRLIQSGLNALSGVLDEHLMDAAQSFAKADVWVRAQVFRTYSEPSTTAKLLLRKFIQEVYFRVRKRLQPRHPTFVFPDGYLGRDIGLIGTYFEYHYINAQDLARLLIQLREWGGRNDSAFMKRCGLLIDRAIDYAVQSSYLNYLVASTKDNARAVMLCETILARLSLSPEGAIPQHWSKAYCRIRREVAPTPALLGYDPFIVGNTESEEWAIPGWDVGRLRDGRQFAINIQEGEFFLGSQATRVTGQSRSVVVGSRA